ncbi:MAG: sigma-54-dependent Fis family transcriptional regulator [Desulfobacterales bacterium]|nr:sigma-54-dependent Fis family transcriptional regulator [Desulfobacterales bacterium]MCP4160853.1 sigma-54-dependent Fis family transcriptional regulator [Deltaproteobacteria bacterium]
MIDKKFTLLIVDDEESVVSSLKRTFIDEDYDIKSASNGMEALKIVKSMRIDAALVDLKMPLMNGMELLDNIMESHPNTMVVMLTGHGGISDAVKAIKKGAMDFIEKPFSVEGLLVRVKQIYKIWSLKNENIRLREKTDTNFEFDRLIGNSTSVLKLKELISKVGPTDTSILIQGETGTGKELVARAIHHHSIRNTNNFVPVDCASINESVFENELFGHIKGAFTGAISSTDGLIRSADKGTLFFDEIGELPLTTQAKLLRSIQEREVRPVGSSKSYSVDVRIVAATNRDLKKEVEKKRFREDLYYRLNVLLLEVPPLSERISDISLLSNYFLDRLKTGFTKVSEISEEAMQYLERYNWPGNIRELENIIRRGIAVSSQKMIYPEDLPEHVTGNEEKNSYEDGEIVSEHSLASYEKEAIQKALEICKNNRRKASVLLRIGEATLYRKIKKYDLDSLK